MRVRAILPCCISRHMGTRMESNSPQENFSPGKISRPRSPLSNEASNLNLLVILAACDGANLLHVIQPTERAPVRAIMGPKRTIKFGEIERATRAFYQTLFEPRSARGAWTAMNDAVSSTEETFSVFPADSIFIYVFRQYLRTLCTPEELDKREARKVAEAVANGLTAERIDHFRQFFRSYVQDHPSYFAKLQRRFFFCDR